MSNQYTIGLGLFHIIKVVSNNAKRCGILLQLSPFNFPRIFICTSSLPEISCWTSHHCWEDILWKNLASYENLPSFFLSGFSRKLLLILSVLSLITWNWRAPGLIANMYTPHSNNIYTLYHGHLYTGVRDYTKTYNIISPVCTSLHIGI